MRLLFFINSLTRGGAQKQMVSLACELKRRGHEVEFATYHQRNHFDEILSTAGVPVHCTPYPRSRRVQLIWGLRRRILQGGYDIVLAYLLTPSLYAGLAGLGLRGRPAIVVSERSSSRGVAWRATKELIERSYRLADHLVLNSHHLREYFADKYRWLSGRTSTIWNGVDLTKHALAPMPPGDHDDVRLLAVGTMLPNKNWIRLAEAIALIRKRSGQIVRVTHVGTGDPQQGADARYVQLLETSLDRLNLRQQWETLQERDDVPALLQSHHALVHPSLVEGLPNAVCEALASGRPVLLSDLFDHPRLVSDGETGFLFDAHQTADTAGAIERFLRASTEQRQAMGRRAREFAEQNLSIQRCADEYETLFTRLTRSHS